MKILTTLSYGYPYLSGLSVYAQQIAGELGRRGHKVEMLTSQYPRSLAKTEVLNGVKITRLPYWASLYKGILMPSWFWVGFCKVLTTDVVVCHLPQVEAFWILFLARIFRKRAIVTYHCDVKLPKGNLNKVIEAILVGLNWASCCLARKIVCSSEDYARSSPVLCRLLNKVVIIYPPIKDFNQFKVSEESKEMIVRRMTGVTIKIGFVGRVSADKGIEYLFEATPLLKRQLKNFRIFLVGPEEAIGEKAYVRKINSLKEKYQSYVTCLGRIPDDSLAYFYKNIDVLVLPSVNATEAFGMVQAEAMLMGVPVVTSDLPGMRVAVNLTRMGETVPPRNSKRIAEAVVKVIKNKKRYSNSREEAKRIFSFDKTVDSYEKIFRETYGVKVELESTFL